MPEVVVLVQDEHQKYPFLHSLSSQMSKNPMSGLCMVTHDTFREVVKLFGFQIFSLMVEDSKLNQYISERQGVVIIAQAPNSAIYNQVKRVVRCNPKAPLLLCFEQPLQNYDLSRFQRLFRTDTPHRLIANCTDRAKEWFQEHMERQPNFHQELLSQTMSDKEFVRQFKQGTLPLAAWDHYGRLRLVYLAIKERGVSYAMRADGWLCPAWRRYKQSIGHGERWNFTLTKFWALMLFTLSSKHKMELSFDQLYQRHPELNNGRLFFNYYQPQTIFSPKARKEWVEPDLSGAITLLDSQRYDQAIERLYCSEATYP